MNYIAILDYEHLDSAIFLKSFSEALSAQRNTRGIILHGDSPYTQRLVQTGMLTEDARLRGTKDLNHRLVSLLADNGVAAIGLNAYQREIIQVTGEVVELDQKLLTGFPQNTHLVLSNLVSQDQGKPPAPFNLAELAGLLHNRLELDEIFIFSKSEADEILTEEPAATVLKFDELENQFIDGKIPDDLSALPLPCRLITTRSFHELPDLSKTILLQ